nr:Z1 domain-containing protein [uncultured Sphaerochaeta sp.]
MDDMTLRDMKTTALLFCKRKQPKNKQELLNATDIFFGSVRYSFGFPKETELEREFIERELFDEILFDMAPSVALIDRTEDFDEEWLAKSNFQFLRSDRYFEYLKRIKHWSEETINELNRTSLEVTTLLGNPRIEGKWSIPRKGLLIGEVQAGKTANYTAVINRAADIGYQVIVVLAGGTEKLRIQTQFRLDQEFVGYTKAKLKTTFISVENIPTSDPIQRPLSLTSALKDFNSSAFQTMTVGYTQNSIALFVIKKNKTVLELLAKSFEESMQKVDGLINMSLLIVDDEADYASVNTHSKEENPTAINAGINKLLSIFARPSYLAVTATPYANIFINADNKKDLFPSDYIFLISPPVTYYGADRMFGSRCGEHPEVIVPIKNSEMRNTYCFGHKNLNAKSKKKDFVNFAIKEFDDLPTSMIKAIRYFLVAQNAMDFLPGVNKHRTMMINVTRFIKRQQELYDVVQEWLENELKPAISMYAGSPNYATNALSGEFHELFRIWKEYDIEHKVMLSWNEFSSHLLETIPKVHTVVVNTKRGDESLDYDAYSDGDRVIAIGGFCLSRGLTLEGLLVSYIYRNSLAYDTLLQMGRWFGYRNSYIEIFKVWMAEDSIDWYTFITEATQDLERQIIEMHKDKNRKPSDFGLAVMQMPDTKLIITALSKMQNTLVAKNPPEAVSISGEFFSTARLPKDPIKNERNTLLIKNFIRGLNAPVNNASAFNASHNCLWQGIKKEAVVSLLRKFSAGIVNQGFKLSELASYIANDYEEAFWDVAVVSLKKDENGAIDVKTSGDISTVNLSYRSGVENGEYIFVNGHHVTVISSGDFKIGLSSTQIRDVKKDMNGYLSNSDNKAYLVSERKPILLLYPLNIGRHPAKNFNSNELFMEGKPIWALTVGFPKIKWAESIQEKKFEYRLNTVAQAQLHVEDESEV